jgi:hypothetical protein
MCPGLRAASHIARKGPSDAGSARDETCNTRCNTALEMLQRGRIARSGFGLRDGGEPPLCASLLSFRVDYDLECELEKWRLRREDLGRCLQEGGAPVFLHAPRRHRGVAVRGAPRGDHRQQAIKPFWAS